MESNKIAVTKELGLQVVNTEGWPVNVELKSGRFFFGEGLALNVAFEGFLSFETDKFTVSCNFGYEEDMFTRADLDFEVDEHLINVKVEPMTETNFEEAKHMLADDIQAKIFFK